MPPTLAPEAPGQLGEPVEPRAMLAYLDELGRWRSDRRAELDALDSQALGATDPRGLTGDMTLAMALWQAVAARHDELLEVWDSGRVGPVERRRLSALIWGRRAAGGGGMGDLPVSLPEACRLSDALTSQLRLRLALGPAAADVAGRLRTLRAALERVRDLVSAAPDEPEREDAARSLTGLDRRLTDLAERAGRGADVVGPLGPLEGEAARLERDLIVAASRRREDERDAERAATLRAELLTRADAAARLEAECVARVEAAPRLAVPRVESLGPVPGEPDAVDAYLLRLAAVERALARVEQAYRAPLAELAALRHSLEAYSVKASATGVGGREEVADLARHARRLIGTSPVDLPRARAAVAAYSTLVTGVPAPGPGGRTT